MLVEPLFQESIPKVGAAARGAGVVGKEAQPLVAQRAQSQIEGGFAIGGGVIGGEGGADG